MSFDALIIGSGFGGSVAALRLAEKGQRVAVVEQGRRIGPAEMEAAVGSLRRLLWAPGLGCHGYFSQTVLRHLTVFGGVGVGGGSLVYAGVLIEPAPALFERSSWRRAGIDWRSELAPHYAEATRMLGCEENQFFGPQDEALRQTARQMGGEESFGGVPLGIYFGEPGVEREDPYFKGRGPRRTGCRLCGGCMIIGCRYGAKNSLDQNYLHLAEAAGAEIRVEHRARLIRPDDAEGYVVECRHPRTGASLPPLRARRVFLAAGVLGTIELLARSREAGALPRISPRLGEAVRTNSEAIVGILSDDRDAQLDRGPSITSHFYVGRTHFTNNRFSVGQEALRLQATPMIDDPRRGWRALRTLAAMLLRPRRMWRFWRARNWHGRITLLSIMQDAENRLALRYRRRGRRGRLVSERGPDAAPSYIAEANRAARIYAEVIGGEPFSSILESVFDTSVTAHPLGGCAVATTASQGVVDPRHEVFGHPGLYVIDGAAMPGNLGVNPALTITAMAERAMALLPGT